MWPELDTHSRPRNDPEGPVCCGVGMPRPDVGSRGGGEGVQDNLPLGMEPGSLRRKKGGSCHISGKALPFRTGDRNSSGWRGWGHGHAPMWERGPALGREEPPQQPLCQTPRWLGHMPLPQFPASTQQAGFVFVLQLRKPSLRGEAKPGGAELDNPDLPGLT